MVTKRCSFGGGKMIDLGAGDGNPTRSILPRKTYLLINKAFYFIQYQIYNYTLTYVKLFLYSHEYL